MKLIRIRCWFQDSEMFIAKLVVTGGFRIIVRKIIDPIAIVTGSLLGEQYDICGKDEEINKLISFINDKDLDIEVIGDGSE